MDIFKLKMSLGMGKLGSAVLKASTGKDLGEHIDDMSNHKKYKAKTIERDNGVEHERVSLEDAKNVKINGKSVVLYSEVGSYLAIEQEGFGVTVRYRKNLYSFKSGTSNAFNFTSSDNYMSPQFNRSFLRIHTHPYDGSIFNVSFDIHNGAANINSYNVPFPLGGPSQGDFKNTFGTTYNLRYVVIDQNFIYLYNSNSNETITIRR